MNLARYLGPEYSRFVASSVLVLAAVLLAISFVTHDGGHTLFGPPLGADFNGFYTAGAILNDEGPERLYDREFHYQRAHELLPNLDRDDWLPFVHPPFVAGVFRVFAQLPYAWACAAWLAVSAGLYLLGLAAVGQTLRHLDASDRTTSLLLALAFEPFIMECWQGGQLSAIGFCAVSVAWWCYRTSRPIAAGAALGVCLYKPTLLVLLLPMLVVGRQGRMLLGFALMAVALAGASVLTVGIDVCQSYAAILLGFTQQTTGQGGLVLRTWKYVDLNAFLRLLTGGPSKAHWPLLLALALAPLAYLARLWWRMPSTDDDRQALTWAATITWTPVLNLYVGVYDSVLVVIGALLTIDISRRRPLPALLALVFVTPWITQPLARSAGVQIYTLALAALGVYQLDLAARRDQAYAAAP
jgi:hypothetical protein